MAKLNIFIDESGFTGADLARPDQPVFALASTILTEEEAKTLYDECFHDIHAIFPLAGEDFELKHSDFVRSNRGRKKLLSFFEKLFQRHKDKIVLWVALKEYVLFCILVDQWIEWAFYELGINFYADDNARYFARASYALIKHHERSTFLKDHLYNFQKMMRNPSPESFDKFWSGIEHELTTCHKANRRFLSLLLECRDILGYEFLEGKQANVLEITFTSALTLVSHWRNQTENPLVLFHDRSSPMIENKQDWDALTHPENDEKKFLIAGLPLQFPLNVESTDFVDSKTHLQIQFSDLLAGACAEFTKYIFDLSADDGRASYGKALGELGIDDLIQNAFAPTNEYEPPAGSHLIDMQQVLDHHLSILAAHRR